MTEDTTKGGQEGEPREGPGSSLILHEGCGAGGERGGGKILIPPGRGDRGRGKTVPSGRTETPAGGAAGTGVRPLPAGWNPAPHPRKPRGVLLDASQEEKGSPVHTAEHNSAGVHTPPHPAREKGKEMGLRWEVWALGACRGGFPNEAVRSQGAGEGQGDGRGTVSECSTREHVHPPSGRPPFPKAGSINTASHPSPSPRLFSVSLVP